MKKHSITFLNFGVLLALVISLNANSKFELRDLLASTTSAAPDQHAAAKAEIISESYYASKLNDFGFNVNSQIDRGTANKEQAREITHCKSLAYRTLNNLPAEAVSKLQNLTLRFSELGRRGLGGGSTIILRCRNVSDKELVSVLVHEIGHIQDTGVLNGQSSSGKSDFMDGEAPVYQNDLSAKFYEISWKNEETKKDGFDRMDFVSGYAMTDPFEDFAETYNFYILHGQEFREMIKENSVLARKYYFMKYFIFSGKDFGNTSEIKYPNSSMRHYDVTIMDYKMDEFFAA